MGTDYHYGVVRTSGGVILQLGNNAYSENLLTLGDNPLRTSGQPTGFTGFGQVVNQLALYRKVGAPSVIVWIPTAVQQYTEDDLR